MKTYLGAPHAHLPQWMQDPFISMLEAALHAQPQIQPNGEEATSQNQSSTDVTYEIVSQNPT